MTLALDPRLRIAFGILLLIGCSIFPVALAVGAPPTGSGENTAAISDLPARPEESTTARAATQRQQDDTKPKKAKTIFEWAIGKKVSQKENGKNENNNGDATNENADSNQKDSRDSAKGEEEKRLEPDRPHLPEASSTVGLGRAILEGGYTYTSKGGNRLQTFPEALLRVGVFADWFEFRIGQGFASQQKAVFGKPSTGEPQPPSRAGANSGGLESTLVSITERNTGAQDLYLGFKLGLTEQEEYLPEMALIPQMTVPSGNKKFSANEVLPGANLDLGWQGAKDRFGLEIVLGMNGAVDDVGHSYVLVDLGLTLIYNPTKKLETFVEWDSFYPTGAIGPATGPQHYVVGGCVYYFTKNFEMDLRAGVGLNDHANDFLAGSGFAIRY